MTRIGHILFCCVILPASACPAGVQISLSQDFDSGSLDVANSTVDGTTVSLVGRNTWTDLSYADRYRWVYFKASGVEGVRPQFNIAAYTFLGSLHDHRFVYSYDQTNWQFFDRGSISGMDYVFDNYQSFTQDEVYVAYSLPYPLARTQQHMAQVAASSYVRPTASGSADFAIGRSAGGVDDCDRAILPNDLYGYLITDPTLTGDRLKVVLAGGNHPCETMGSHALEGMIDFILSDDPIAVGLRAKADFYVYPQMNPDGRVAGYYRSTPENPDKDFNRYWHNPTGFTDMTAVRDAMLADTGGDVDYLFDFHGMFGPWTRPHYFAVRPSDVGSDFAAALARIEPEIVETATAATPGMLRDWAMSWAGLKAEYAFTAEFGAHPGVLEERLDEMGANYARALAVAIGVVPEPATALLVVTALITLLCIMRQRRGHGKR